MAFASLALWERVPSLKPLDWLELAILFVAMYLFLRFLRRTVAGGMFRGPAMLIWVAVLGLLWWIQAGKMDVLNRIFKSALPIFITALVVTFQMELRHGVARWGNRGLLRRLMGRRTPEAPEVRVSTEIIRAVQEFASKRVGALIAIERNIDLTNYIETGVPMDAVIRAETLATIFSTDTVLHDGAVIVRHGRIAAAGCLLPLTERPQLARDFGTRHRAALGLSEQSDALVIVVSEERGQIHAVERGEMTPHADAKWLRGVLNVAFAEKHGLAPKDRGAADASRESRKTPSSGSFLSSLFGRKQTSADGGSAPPGDDDKKGAS